MLTSVIFATNWFKIAPDYEGAVSDARVRLCESVTLRCVLAIRGKRPEDLPKYLSDARKLDPHLLSLGVKKYNPESSEGASSPEGELIATEGQHGAWKPIRK